MDPESCAPFSVGPATGPYAATGDEPPGPQGTPDAAPHLHPAPPRGQRLSRFPACGPLEPYLPEPAKPPAKYLQDLGPGPVLNGGHFYEGPAEGKAQQDPVSFPLHPPAPLSFPDFLSHFPASQLWARLVFPTVPSLDRYWPGQARPVRWGRQSRPCPRWQQQGEAGGQRKVEWRRSWAHSDFEGNRT